MPVYIVGRGDASSTPHLVEDAWTAFSDVGVVDGGDRFSLHEYLETECQYLEFFDNIIREAGLVIVAEPRILDAPEPWERELMNGVELSGNVARSLFRNQLRGAGNGCNFYLPNIEVRIRTAFDYYLSIEAGESFGSGDLHRLLPSELAILSRREDEPLDIITRECDDQFWIDVASLVGAHPFWIIEKFAQGGWGQIWYRVESSADLHEVRGRLRTYSAVYVLDHLDFDVCILEDVFDKRSAKTAALTTSVCFRFPPTEVDLLVRPLSPSFVRQRLGDRNTYAIARDDVVGVNLDRPDIKLTGIVPGEFSATLPRWLS